MDCMTELVVPFFFVTSGFLLFDKIQNNPDKKKSVVFGYCKRILQLYFIWSAVMLIFKIPEIINNGFDIKKQFIWWGKYFRVLFLIGDYQLWYLIGLVWASILFYFLYRSNKLNKPIIMAILLWIIRIILDCNLYKSLNSPILNEIVKYYNFIFGTTQNGIFAGFVFLVLGCVFAKYKIKITNYTTLFIISIVVTVISFLGLYYSQKSSQMVIAYLTLVIEVAGCFATCIVIPIYNIKTKKLGELSTIIYVSHMSIILLAHRVMELLGVQIIANHTLFVILTTIIIVLIGIIICFVGNKNKIVRKFY